MAYDSYCSRCNVGCQSQNTCQTCNSCESCNTACNASSGCNTLQAFCTISSQSAGHFNFGACVSSGQIIGHESDEDSSQYFTRANWNRLISYINAAYAKGNASNGGNSGVSICTDDFITASSFNAVAAALGHLGSRGPGLSVNQNDVIYGSYFETLESYADSLLLKTTQCDTCNTTCNITCKECQVCNTSNCGSCNGSCQSHSPSYGSSCESCNTCQICNIGCQNQTATDQTK